MQRVPTTVQVAGAMEIDLHRPSLQGRHMADATPSDVIVLSKFRIQEFCLCLALLYSAKLRKYKLSVFCLTKVKLH